MTSSKKKYPLIRSYVQDSTTVIPTVFLTDEEYGRALQCFVPACTDIVPVNFAERLFYLAERQVKPMTGMWWIGGRMKPGEAIEVAAIRNFKRETQVELAQDRLQLAGIFDYIWKDRAQPPQNIGCHMLGITYVVQLNAEELFLASEHLEKVEYASGSGLRAYSRADLVREQVFPTILDLYDDVFPRVEVSPTLVDSI